MYELDNDTIGDILDSFTELYDEVESTLALLHHSDDNEDLNKIFRAIHTIKGHAAMFQLSALVDYTHALEEIAESLRSHKYEASDAICECIQLGMDRLRDLHLRELKGQNFANLNETTIERKFMAIAAADKGSVEGLAQSLLSYLAAGVEKEPNTNSHNTEHPTIESREFQNPLSIPANQRIYADLAFFQEMSFQMDCKNPYWVDRSIQLFDWAQKLNTLGSDAVDYQQLAAATYMHDIGMTFLPSAIISKTEKLSAQEYDEVKRHTVWGYELLNRMEGWAEAAQIVLQHHERIDGAGYPSKLSGDDIHPGAKILAILDAFFSMIRGRADRAQRRSSIRAISEINAVSGSQFDSYWVALFNDMIKQEVKSGLI